MSALHGCGQEAALGRELFVQVEHGLDEGDRAGAAGEV